MARGFDSKQVEEQQSMAQDKAPKPAKEQLTPEQQTVQHERANFELARTKLQNDLAASTNERYRAMLQAALKDVEKKLGHSSE